MIYGKIGSALFHFLPSDTNHYLVYRFLNIFLFILTLSILFFAPYTTIQTLPIALAFLCIPQISYIYSYANYDGWALSLTVFLFVWALLVTQKKTRLWSWPQTILLGVLTGLLFASRQPDILGLVLPSIILGEHVFRNCNGRQEATKYIIRLGAIILIAFSIAAPLKLIYPLSQDDYHISYRKMREEKAIDPFKPSIKSAPLYHLAEKGETYYHMLSKRRWPAMTFQSFYSGYGYMALFSPFLIYLTAGAMIFFAFSISVASSVLHWRSINNLRRWILIFSPLLFAVNIGASIYHSMHIDFQPQGRYLFCTLIPFCLFLTGVVCNEGRHIQLVRICIFTILYILTMVNLYTIAPLAQPPHWAKF